MAATLGKDVVSSFTGIANADIRSVTTTDEAETIDVTARGSNGYKEYDTGFENTTVEIECLNHSLAVEDTVGSLIVVSIATNEPLDDVVSYTITLKPKDT
jgi:hypothetical protein